MWRSVLQHLTGGPLLAAAAAGSCRGAWRPGQTSNAQKAAARFLSRATLPGGRPFCSLGSSEERVVAGREPAGDGGGGPPEQHLIPPAMVEVPEGQVGKPFRDVAPSAFTFHEIVSLLRQENASDICVIQLPPELKYSNHFIIVSGSSGRHLHAMAQYLLKMYKYTNKDHKARVVIEGKDCDDWLCIDFGHTVVHFMLPETREVYELEKLWTLGSYDDQLAQMVSEALPADFVLGLTSEEDSLDSV